MCIYDVSRYNKGLKITNYYTYYNARIDVIANVL